MRAGFLDPRGPKVWRTIPYVLPTFALLFAVFGPVSGLPAGGPGPPALRLLNSLWRHARPPPCPPGAALD